MSTPSGQARSTREGLRKVFSEALVEMGKGKPVEEALVAASRRGSREETRNTLWAALSLFLHVRESTGWGPLRTVRELSSHPERWENPYLEEVDLLMNLSPGVLSELFRKAEKRREAGYSLEDSLEMASAAMDPDSAGLLFRTALFLVKTISSLRDIGENAAFREMRASAAKSLCLEE